MSHETFICQWFMQIRFFMGVVWRFWHTANFAHIYGVRYGSQGPHDWSQDQSTARWPFVDPYPCEAMRRQPTAGCSPDEITSKISLKISQIIGGSCGLVMTSGSFCFPADFLWPIETRKWKKRIPWWNFRQVARSCRCREVIPPGGNVKFQTLTISSSKITFEPTKPSISQSCPGAHGLGSPKSSLGMAAVRSRRRRRKLHVENVSLIPAPTAANPKGTSLSHGGFPRHLRGTCKKATDESGKFTLPDSKDEKRALRKSRSVDKPLHNMIGSFGSFGSFVLG